MLAPSDQNGHANSSEIPTWQRGDDYDVDVDQSPDTELPRTGRRRRFDAGPPASSAPAAAPTAALAVTSLAAIESPGEDGDATAKPVATPVAPRLPRLPPPTGQRPVNRPPLSDRQIEMMLATFLLYPEAFARARKTLRPETFAIYQRNYAMLWEIADAHFADCGAVPGEEFMASEFSARFEDSPGLITDSEIEIIDDFLRQVGRLTPEDLNPKVAFKYLQRFLDDRLIEQARRELLLGTQVPADLCAHLQNLATRASQNAALAGGDAGPQIASLNTSDFLAADFSLEYLIPGVLVSGQPAILGGPAKSLKTSMAVDLAISLATATPFLGHFPVPKTVRCGIISAESGDATLQNLARRISASKGIDGREVPVQWSSTLPQLSDPNWQDAMRRWVEKHQLQVFVLDPLYLAIGSEAAQNSGNLYAMGSLLRRLADTLADTGVTLLMCHHFSKSATLNLAKNGYDAPALEDLSQSGLSEFARQWLLMSRREKFDDGSGRHELWLRAGGSAGHSGLFALTIDEGRQTDPGGRRWAVAVRTGQEIAAAAAAAKDAAGVAKQHQTKVAVLAFLRQHPAGETQKQIEANVPGGHATVRQVIAAAMSENLLEPCEIVKQNKRYPALRIAQRRPQEGQTSEE